VFSDGRSSERFSGWSIQTVSDGLKTTNNDQLLGANSERTIQEDGAQDTKTWDQTDEKDEQEDEEGPGVRTEEGILPTEQRLIRKLLRNYEKSVRPVRNASETVLVKMGLTMTQIFDLVNPF